MHVLFLPYTEENPYQELLTTSLSGHETSVFSISGTPRSVLEHVRTHGLPDIIHFHWLAPFLISDRLPLTLVKSVVTTVGLVIARLLGVRIVWTVHNVLEHDRRHPLYERTVKHVLVRLLIDALIVHCTAAYDTVAESLRLPDSERANVAIIPHGHYIGYYKDEITREKARSELGYSADETLFLYFGKIRPYKQVPKLIESFESVEDPNARLLIVGSSPDEDYERVVTDVARRSERIDLHLQFVPNDSIQRYLNAADIAVFPYDEILTSGSAILGMSFGLPIVAPHIGCLPELLPTDSNILYDADETNALRGALERATRSDLKSMSESNLSAARALDWDQIGGETAEVYQSIQG